MMNTNDAPRAAPELPLWRVERILHDAQGLLVVNKPAGLVVHGGDETLKDDCVSRLGQWLTAQGRPSQLYVHQRLDQDTSGVLFFLTDPALNATFAAAMEQHTIERRYLAVVEWGRAVQSGHEPGSTDGGRGGPQGRDRSVKDGAGRFSGGGGARAGRGARPAARGTSAPDRAYMYPTARDLGLTQGKSTHELRCPLQPTGSIELHLRHERGRSLVVAPGSTDAKRALTHYRIIKQLGRRALVELTLSTGRPHQIRASLAHLGAPVLGDRLYHGVAHGRLMLHAVSLSGGPLPQAFVAPLPDDFEHAMLSSTADTDRAPGSGRAEDELTAIIFDAAMRRAPVARKTSAFRLINGEPDGLSGCTIDAYGPYAVINPYNIHYDHGTLSLMGGALLKLGFAGVYVKQRVRADLRKQDADELAPNVPLCGQTAPERLVIDELGMKLGIELHDGLSTGLFVDMRKGRKLVRDWAEESQRSEPGAAGRVAQTELLNLFCYTCSFSVAAALGGARTTNVDLAGRALARGRVNLELTGLDPAAHRFFKEDALKYLKKAVRRGERYQIIVLDPPSFATVGKSTFSVAEHYGQAVQDCFTLLSPGGRLLCVTNHQKTQVGTLLRVVNDAAQKAGRSVRSVRALTSSLDCPDHLSGPFPSKAVLAQLD
jgi:23S rRNA (cytosine1962-C5)-methyltransferase